MKWKCALIIGATSSLAISICRQLGEAGINMILVGRDQEQLSMLAQDLTIRYQVKIITEQLDLNSSFKTSELITSFQVKIEDKIDLCVVAAGDIASADIKTMTNVNYIAPAIIMSAVADTMETNTSTIIVISSVAGDRGRKSNYIYGSAKAALSSFASGLRNRYFGKIHVMTVKPGFLDTPMTYGMNSKLIFNKDKAAKIILNAAAKKVDVLYVPFFWRYIMLIIKTIPEIVFKRLNL